MINAPKLITVTRKVAVKKKGISSDTNMTFSLLARRKLHPKYVQYE